MLLHSVNFNPHTCALDRVSFSFCLSMYIQFSPDPFINIIFFSRPHSYKKKENGKKTLGGFKQQQQKKEWYLVVFICYELII